MQDVPRHQLPKGKVWNMTDAIPETDGAPVARRGGWSRPWSAMSNTAATYAAGVAFAPFTAGSQVVGIDNAGKFHYTTFAASSFTAGVASRVPAQVPTFWRDRLFLLDINGTSAPIKYDGSGALTVSGSPPTATMSCVYKNHLVFARSNAEIRRVWFSDAGDYDSWDTGADGQWLDMDIPVQGIDALRNMILVFGEGSTQRIRGDIIPGVVGSDMVVEPMFSVGCSDPASVATSDDFAVFANAEGIYMTDGIGLVDLTEQAGVTGYWRDQMQAYGSGYTIAGALHRGWYIFSVNDGGSFVHAGMLNVRKRVFVKLTNFNAQMICSTPIGLLDTRPRLIFAERGSLRIADWQYLFNPSSAEKDGDNTDITPVIETPFYFGRPGRKRWHSLYPRYRLLAGSETPTLTLSYTTDQSVGGAYTAMSPTLTGATGIQRKRRALGFRSEGVAFKVTQTNASAYTELHSFEADAYGEEPGRV